jgi:hypothetical protein
MSDESNLIEERFARLESLLVRQDAKLHTLRWQRQIAVLLLGILGAVLLIIPLSGAGPGATTFEGLIAKQLILRDEKGKNRIILYADDDNSGPGLVMFDGAGRIRCSVGLGANDHGGMTFRDKKGLMRLCMGVDSTETPYFNLRDSTERIRSSIDVDPAGYSQIAFFDAKSKVNMLLGENEDHKSTLILRSPTSKSQTKLETGENSTLVIDDAKGQTVFEAAKPK